VMIPVVRLLLSVAVGVGIWWRRLENWRPAKPLGEEGVRGWLWPIADCRARKSVVRPLRLRDATVVIDDGVMVYGCGYN